MKVRKEDIFHQTDSERGPITVKCWCRICWTKLFFVFDYEDMKGHTLEQIRRMCEYRHTKDCLQEDVRLG